MSKFAKEIEYAQPALSKIETGGKPLPITIAKKLSDRYNINSNWLLFGKGEMLLEKSNDQLASFKYNVKLFDIEAFAGIGTDIVQMEQVIEQWYIPGLFGDHFAVKISGTSMQGTLEHGDIIVVKKIEDFTEIKTNRIYLIICDGSPLVKRLIVSQNSIELRSDNPFHKPQSTHVDSEKISAVYKVISFLRNFENLEIL
jgi:phage repressor protein C with HTH and peptisase S24 domain